MSTAAEVFKESITDAETLLRHFNDLNTHPPPPDIEVLKRAGLIMAMTAWETYVEDCIQEIAATRIEGIEDDLFADFVRSKLDEEIRRLHNPGAEKTIELFRDFAGVDLAKAWHWNSLDSKTVRRRLNDYLKLRGEVVHRSRPLPADAPNAHPVKKVDLVKAIAFLKNLVQATEAALAASTANKLKSEGKLRLAGA
jgi:hypothetical protein